MKKTIKIEVFFIFKFILHSLYNRLLIFSICIVLIHLRSVIIITKSGYIKRMSIAEFEAQQRGGRGKAGARLSTEKDAVAHFFACNDHDTLIFTTDR